MSRRNRISVDVHIDEYVSANVDVDDVIESLDEAGKAKLMSALGIGGSHLGGDGDAAFARNVVMRAEMAARRMRDLPREIHDLFWHVHGVAL